MSQTDYSWKRYWLPTTSDENASRFAVNSASPYLVDPEENPEFWKLQGHSPLTLKKVLKHNCVLLLGERGIGKTRCLKNERSAIEKDLKAADDKVLWVDLADCVSDRLVDSEIFEDPQFQEWKNGSHNLHLFLDSFDECQEFVPGLAQHLNVRLRRCDIERLRLRISCRTSHWPKKFGEHLSEMWANSGGMRPFQLLPLTQANVAAALSKNGINTDKFFSSVKQSGLEPLCARPLTLELQIAAFKKSPTKPKSVVGTYQEGISKLLEPESESSAGPSIRLKLPEKERMTFASNTAAATMFCNRAAIWMSGKQSDPPNTDVLLEDLCFETLAQKMQGKPYSEIQILKEILASGLFKAAGIDRIVWAHKTFEEFLAAYYLVQKQLTDQQIFQLLVHPLSESGEITPQLRGVAAWLIEMGAKFVDKLSPLDRASFLKSDIPFTDYERKRTTVEAILQCARADLLSWSSFGDVRHHYPKLAYDGLAKLLKEVVLNEQENGQARLEAYWIALRCGETLLSVDELITVLLDESAPFPLKRDTLHNVVRHLQPTDLLKLLPFARIDIANDHQEFVKATVLTELWGNRRLISAEQFLASLSDPKRSDGFYSEYLFRETWWVQLQFSDLDTIFRFLNKLAQESTLTTNLALVAQNLIHFCLSFLSSKGVLESLTRVFVESVSKSHELISWKILVEISKKNARVRRTFVQAVLGEAKPENAVALAKVLQRNCPLNEKDLRWLLSMREKIETSALEVILDDLLAVSAKKEVQAKTNGLASFDMFEKNGPLAWLDWCESLPPRTSSQKVFEAWRNADVLQQNRMLRAAKQFLEKAPGLPGFDPELPDVSRAAYRAQFILLSCGQVGDMISQETSANWAKSAYEHYFHVEQRSDFIQATHEIMLREAIRSDPELLERAFEKIVRAIHGRTWSLADILWEEEGEEAFLGYLDRHSIGPLYLEPFVEFIIKKAPHRSTLLEDWLQYSDGTTDSKDIVAASLIIRLAEPVLIERVMMKMEADFQFAKRFFEFVLDDSSFMHSDAISRLSEPQIFVLFQLLERYAEDPDVIESVRDRDLLVRLIDQAGLWQELALYELQRKGTPLALKQLSKIKKAGWDMLVNESRQFALRASWSAPKPAEFIDVILNSNKRLIRSERELLEAVIESLASFESGLQGETPLAFTLWDEIREGRSKSESVWKPKDENSFSDVIKHHLIKEMKERGLFINREVEIVRARAGGQGERLDIDVSALIPGSNAGTFDPIKVVVEVKGSWNAGLFESMETQLADRYLNTLECTHGIYLVGWFFSNKSDKKYVPAKMTLETLRSKLAEQSIALSNNKRRTIRAVVIDATLK